MFVKFNHLVHMGKLIKDEPYVLTSQVDQVFYVEDGRNPNWVCAVRTKPHNVYNVGQGEGSNEAGTTYHECVPVLRDGDAHFLPFCQRHFPTQCFKQVLHTRFTLRAVFGKTNKSASNYTLPA
jgi:hypothetical protein